MHTNDLPTYLLLEDHYYSYRHWKYLWCQLFSGVNTWGSSLLCQIFIRLLANALAVASEVNEPIQSLKTHSIVCSEIILFEDQRLDLILKTENALSWCILQKWGLKTLQISQILFFLACGKYLLFRELPNQMRKCLFRKIAQHRSHFWQRFSFSSGPIFGWGLGYWFMSNIMKDWHLPEYNGD